MSENQTITSSERQTNKTFLSWISSNELVRQTSVLTFSNVIVAIIGLAQGIIVARLLGPKLYGIAALIMGYPLLIFTLLDARSSDASIKYLSEFHASEKPNQAEAVCKLGYVVDGAIAIITLLIGASSAGWAASTFMHSRNLAWLVILYASVYVPQALVGTSYAILVTLGKFSLVALVDMITAAIRVALVLTLVMNGWQVSGVVFGNAAGLALSGLVYGFAASKAAPIQWKIFPWQGNLKAALEGRYHEIIRFLAFNDLGVLIAMIPKKLDVLLLGYFRNATDVGYYALAKSVAGITNHLLSPLQSVVYPELAQLWASNKNALKRKVRKLALHVGLPLGATAFCGIALVPGLLPLFLGQGYRPAVGTCQVLLAGYAVWLSCFWVKPLFLAEGKVKEWTLFISTISVTVLLGWLFAMPKYGYFGASLSWTAPIVIYYAYVGLQQFRRLQKDFMNE